MRSHMRSRGFRTSRYKFWVTQFNICMCACWVTWVMSDFLWPYELQPTRLLSPWDSPARILECVAMPSSRRSSLPRDQTHVSYVSEHKDIQRMAPALAGGSFTTSASTHKSIHRFQLSTGIHRASRVYHLKINLFHCKFLESRNSVIHTYFWSH